MKQVVIVTDRGTFYQGVLVDVDWTIRHCTLKQVVQLFTKRCDGSWRDPLMFGPPLPYWSVSGVIPSVQTLGVETIGECTPVAAMAWAQYKALK